MESHREEIKFKDTDFTNIDILNRKPYRIRRCPVIVTLADTQITPVDIQKMLEAGMNVAKFKMPTSTKGDRIKMLGKIDKAVLACCHKYGVTNWPVATCVELKTCVVKTGILENDEEYINTKEGDQITLTCLMSEYNKCNNKKIFVDNPYLANDVKVGTIISLNSDEIVMKCTGIIDDKSIKCVVTKGGCLTNLCSFCARGIKRSRPHITKKDLQIVKFALEYQIDIIIINYVRHVDCIKKVKQYIGKKIERPVILCGICTQEGISNLDDILKEADGIILTRDLLPYELLGSCQFRLANIQKWMTGKCIQVGKPLFISGGVFVEALKTGQFNDNEVMDVSNALLDGISGFLLKDCYDTDLVLEVLKAMNVLSNTVEPLTTSKIGFQRLINEVKLPVNAAEAAMISCAMLANRSEALMIVIPTVTGKTLKILSRMRPSCLIVTVSTKVRVTRMLHTYKGVIPLLYIDKPQGNWKKSVEARIDYAVVYAVKRSLMQYGDYYITLQRGSESSSFCDTVRIFKVSISKKPLVECPEDPADFMSNTNIS